MNIFTSTRARQQLSMEDAHGCTPFQLMVRCNLAFNGTNNEAASTSISLPFSSSSEQHLPHSYLEFVRSHLMEVPSSWTDGRGLTLVHLLAVNPAVTVGAMAGILDMEPVVRTRNNGGHDNRGGRSSGADGGAGSGEGGGGEQHLELFVPENPLRGGLNPLHLVCGDESSSPGLTGEFIRLLLSRLPPGSGGQRDHRGRTPLHLLCTSDSVTTDCIAAYLGTVKALLTQRTLADPSTRTNHDTSRSREGRDDKGGGGDGDGGGDDGKKVDEEDRPFVTTRHMAILFMRDDSGMSPLCALAANRSGGGNNCSTNGGDKVGASSGGGDGGDCGDSGSVGSYRGGGRAGGGVGGRNGCDGSSNRDGDGDTGTGNFDAFYYALEECCETITREAHEVDLGKSTAGLVKTWIDERRRVRTCEEHAKKRGERAGESGRERE